MLIELTNASFGYGGFAVVVAEGLRVERGRCLGIYGPNGAGKTTLVRGLLGLIPPMRGDVVRAPGLRLAYLPQHRAMQLHWPMTGFDAAALSITRAWPFGVGGRQREALREKMSLLGVDALGGETFAKLSGGQQQRLLLAGLLATSPDVLVLDEPTDGLDVTSTKHFLDQLRSVATADAGVVMISHDLDELTSVAQEIAWVHPSNEEQGPRRVEPIPAGAAASAAGGAAR